MNERDVGQVALDDGRRLAWYQFGDPAGFPVFYFHGFPGSGAEARWGDGPATSAGLRLIGLDRPGFGRSDPQPRRTLLGWAGDVLAVARALAAPRFSVLGMSGGAPYALACAAHFPERIARVMVVSGLGPMPRSGVEPTMTSLNRLGLRLARRKMTATLLDAVAPLIGYLLSRHPDRVVARLGRMCGPRDREALEALGLGPVLVDSFRRAVGPGARGMVTEARLFARFTDDWLSRITAPVHWYHGDRDVIVPLVMARRAEAAIGQCTLRVYPGEGHFSVLANHLSDVFEERAAK